MSILGVKTHFVNSEFDKSPNIRLLSACRVKSPRLLPGVIFHFHFLMDGCFHWLQFRVLPNEPIYYLDPSLRDLPSPIRQAIYKALDTQIDAWPEEAVDLVQP